MTYAPIHWRWDGEVMRPHRPRDQTRARIMYHEGDVYLLDAHDEVSAASRGHYFASLKDAWDSLPDEQLKRFPSVEHLRKWALVRAGYCVDDYRTYGTPEDAKIAARHIRAHSQFGVITVEGNIVLVRTARSQSSREMSREEFQESKTKVLNIVEDLLGVPTGHFKEPA